MKNALLKNLLINRFFMLKQQKKLIGKLKQVRLKQGKLNYDTKYLH